MERKYGSGYGTKKGNFLLVREIFFRFISDSYLHYLTFHSVNRFDVTECNGEIYGVFLTVSDKTWGTFQYDRKENRWTDLGIPLVLDPTAEIHLCSFDI